MDGNSPLCKCLIQDTHQPADSPPCDWIPAVHAGMTGFNHLCITTRAGAWEPANQQIGCLTRLAFWATNLRRDTIKAYPFALSLSKGERVSRSWFDKLTTNGLTCPALSW